MVRLRPGCLGSVTSIAKSTLADRLRTANPLPPGTFAVGVGMAAAGLGAYGFLVTSARALGKQEYAPLSVLWALVFLAGPGFFLPLEQEVGRALAARRSRNEGGAPVIRRAAAIGGVVLGTLLVLGLAFRRPLIDGLFSHERVLYAAWLVALAGACATHLVRGTLSGQGRFGAYARCIGGEAGIRFALCAGLAWAGASTAGPYGVAVAVGPFLAIAFALRGERDLLGAGPPAPWSEVTRALASLLVGSVLSMALVNAGPLAMELLATKADEDEAGRFLAGLVIARIPLFMFQAIQAALLPTLSALASEGRTEEFRRGLGRLVGWLGLVAVAGLLAATTVGPFAVQALFGSEFELGRRTMGMLALGSGAFMVALAVAQANIALGGHSRMALAWAAGVTGLVVALTLAGQDLFLRVELSTVIGSVVALAAQLAVLGGLLRSGAMIDQGDLLEAINDISLEP